ncbi:hypothetical protein SAMN05216296_2461 [Pseudomonas pohangensis]|uniref:Uncharacterized protein n=1 Tax=Pseudomonas pohangensis TaxID=364197 RepID=A0A1H2GQK9_9PSED|nr:hypothetical protein [Pseudomonas pohangensis]SDU21749.1 hypothetical protein SAMN05216296_2461 [Pseudomonas pohangensis]
MSRFFISPHPTFGSYAKPKEYLVEQSPYFWWWYALTLNEQYSRLCEQKTEQILLAESQTESEQKMLKVYEDFGDVRYEGSPYVAFAQWWSRKVASGEKRGEYLFAEPAIQGMSVRVVKAKEAAEALVGSAETLLVSIPLSLQRQHIDKALNKILKKHLVSKAMGREVRNPKHSQSLYSLSKPAVPAVLKKTFELMDAKHAAELRGVPLGNVELAEVVRLAYSERAKSDEISTEANRRRNISITVSRYISNAKSMIENAGYGLFP